MIDEKRPSGEESPEVPENDSALSSVNHARGSEEDSEENLPGQYYIHLAYTRDGRNVCRTAVVTSKNLLTARDVGRSAADSDTSPHLTSLLTEHKKISGYAAIGDQTATEVSSLPTLRLKYEIEQEVGKSVIRVRKRSRTDLFVSKSLDKKAVNSAIGKYWASVSHGFAVQNAIFVGMVTTFDELIAQLIRHVLKHSPDILNSFDLKIPYKDVVAAEDFSVLQDRLVRDLVDELMWKGRLDQLKWLEQTITKEKFSETIPHFDRFVEIAERRNIYVHNNGVVNANYVNRVNIKKANVPQAKNGEKLYLTKTYFVESADVLVEAYVIIAQKVIRKMMRGANNLQRENLDTHFNQAVFDQLDAGRYESAARLASTMLKGGFVISDMTRKMGAVNLGIALKKSGDELAASEALDSVDWSSARKEFHLCIAALKEDDEQVYRLIPQMIGSDLVVPESYFEWPAFDWMRCKAEFWEVLQRTYGDAIKKAGEDGE